MPACLDIYPDDKNSTLIRKLLSTSYSIMVMAAHIRQLADYRFGSSGQPLTTRHDDLQRWYIEDAVAVWHGYRYGVPQVSPASTLYGFSSLEVFQDRGIRLNELLDSVVLIGPGSARRSVPIFQRYWGMR